jgi:hypothetical protein
LLHRPGRAQAGGRLAAQHFQTGGLKAFCYRGFAAGVAVAAQARAHAAGGGVSGGPLAGPHRRQPVANGPGAEHRRQLHLAQEAGIEPQARVHKIGVHQQQGHLLHAYPTARGHMGPQRGLVHVGLVTHRGQSHLEDPPAMCAALQYVDAYPGAVVAGQAGTEEGGAFGLQPLVGQRGVRAGEGFQPIGRGGWPLDHDSAGERRAQCGFQAGAWHLRGLGHRREIMRPFWQRLAASQQPVAARAAAPLAQVFGGQERGIDLHGGKQTNG